METSKKHARKVVRLSREMQDNYAHSRKVRIYHGTSNSTRVLSFKKNGVVDISDLDQVIKVNKNGRYAIVEPNVPMDKLVNETLKHGLIPPVVMEFPGITVGGGIQGGAGESSSFKWGLFDNCCLEYEVILGNGKVVKASPKVKADLFYGLASSYGSVGIISAAKLKLIPAKKYVRLKYIKVNSFEEVVEVIKKETKRGSDFVDGILFSKNLGVVMEGTLTDYVDLPITTFSKTTDEWFYLHAKKNAEKKSGWEEIIPIRDYFFRYDQGTFWVSRYAFLRLKFPFNRFTRMLFNVAFKTRAMFRFLQALKTSQQTITQDISLSADKIFTFLDYLDKNINIYPLWFCPLRPIKDAFLSPIFMSTDLIINVGVWGKLIKDFKKILNLNRKIEKKTLELGGRKILYAQCYYPESEFWSIYDRQKYDKLREKYDSTKTFPDIYDKVIVKEKYKVSYLGGLVSFIKSPTKYPIS